MVEFVYNSAKNVSTGHIFFELNCSYHPQVFFKDNIDFCFKSHTTNELAKKLRELINICQQNLFHAQKFKKKAYDNGMKPQSYALREKFWLNSKYIKTKQN